MLLFSFVLSQISNCQSLGRKNKHEILKTDRRHAPASIGTYTTSAAQWLPDSRRKGTNGVSTHGVTADFMLFDRGTFWVLPLSYFYLPQSARAYLFPPFVKNHYFCSGPISVESIVSGGVPHRTISATRVSRRTALVHDARRRYTTSIPGGQPARWHTFIIWIFTFIGWSFVGMNLLKIRFFAIIGALLV